MNDFDTLSDFERIRKKQFDVQLNQDFVYWNAFKGIIIDSKFETQLLIDFLKAKLQCDMAYAGSLKSVHQTYIKYSKKHTSRLDSGIQTSMDTTSKLQAQLADKIVQFCKSMQSDVIDMKMVALIKMLDKDGAEIVTQGDLMNNAIRAAMDAVLKAFIHYDKQYHMLKNRQEETEVKLEHDLWMIELKYVQSVQVLKQCRYEYVQKMACIYKKFKAMEKMRCTVMEQGMQTYLSQQQILYAELSGSVKVQVEAWSRLDFENDILKRMKTLPKNQTATALACQEQRTSEKELFSLLNSPIKSPHVVHPFRFRLQMRGTFHNTWQSAFGVITTSRILHIFNINGKDEPQDLFYDTTNTYRTSLYLSNCAVTLDKDQTCTLTESQPLTGIVGIFKSESTRQFTFSFSNVDDLDQFKTFL